MLRNKTMVASQTGFPDTENHWAKPFIEGLANQGMISGFPDGRFRPNLPMNRSQFAAILKNAFSQPEKQRSAPTFIDVSQKHWAKEAIQYAYETGFMSGYPGNRFRPEANIVRVEALVAIASGLNLPLSDISDVNIALPQLYQDVDKIPGYARDRIASATDANIIVNYPNPKRLRPTQVATRADVAAFIYQALTYLGQVPELNSKYTVAFQTTRKVSHQREFRGVWVASVWNIDWPSEKGLAAEQQQEELIEIIDRIEELNLNAMFLQVRPTADALYASELEPWSEWLTGTQGQAPEPFYDPLEFAIAECHKRNIELHAWFNPFRAATGSQVSTKVKPHISVTHSNYVYQYGKQLWMDPGVKTVQDWSYNVILDVVDRYDVDGIHLDDYFYPYPIKDQDFPDQKTYEAYQEAGGELSLGDWRRDNVNKIVERLYTGIKATKPTVKFGISPFGIYRPGQPPQIKGLDQYQAIYADPKKWLEEGWVDYIAPQLYWPIEPPAQSYPVLLQWWTENNPKNRHIYSGNRLSKLGGEEWPISEYEEQVEISRNLRSKLSLGNIFYSMKVFTENRLEVVDQFKSSIYSEPAVVPSMEWLKTEPPKKPGNVRARDGKLSWQKVCDGETCYWTLYRQQDGVWRLYKILNSATLEIALESGVYALSAVDRIGNESVGVVVSLG